jgi:hypothetical protein
VKKDVEVLHFAVRLVVREPRRVTVKRNCGEMVLPDRPKSEGDHRGKRCDPWRPSGGKAKASEPALSLL